MHGCQGEDERPSGQSGPTQRQDGGLATSTLGFSTRLEALSPTRLRDCQAAATLRCDHGPGLTTMWMGTPRDVLLKPLLRRDHFGRRGNMLGPLGRGWPRKEHARRGHDNPARIAGSSNNRGGLAQHRGHRRALGAWNQHGLGQKRFGHTRRAQPERVRLQAQQARHLAGLGVHGLHRLAVAGRIPSRERRGLGRRRGASVDAEPWVSLGRQAYFGTLKATTGQVCAKFDEGPPQGRSPTKEHTTKSDVHCGGRDVVANAVAATAWPGTKRRPPRGRLVLAASAAHKRPPTTSRLLLSV